MIMVTGSEKQTPRKMPEMRENAAIIPAVPLCSGSTFLQYTSTHIHSLVWSGSRCLRCF